MRILIKHADVFDGKHSDLKEHRNIVIDGNIVIGIEKEEVAEENFDEVIDASGFVAIPGLTDAHVHLGHTFMANNSVDYDVAISTAVARKLLYQGFTTVRDAGGISSGIKKAIDQGVIEGPRIYPSNAHISQTSGHGDSEEAHGIRDIQYRIPRAGVLADGEDEILRAVREQLFHGASQIKLMAGGGCASNCDPLPTIQFSEKEMRTAVEAAADYGTYVMTHLYTNPSMQRAARAGVRSFEHAHLLDEETAKLIKDQGVFIAPMPQFSAKEEEVMKYMSRKETFENLKKQGSKADVLRKGMLYATEWINKYDLKLLFGTDLMITFPGYEPRSSYDLTKYKERFGSFKGLLGATGNINDLIKYTTYQNPYPDGEIGILEKGSYADILLVRGNPVEDLAVLSDTDNIKLILKDGVVYKNEIRSKN